ncbi:MAG: methylisocitrate lyase [Bdellovibrionales bacterium]|nr:methylisocitrate lyase [Bdellovibrionales bacterium]
MLFAKKTGATKRAEFRAALRSGKLLRFPGAFSPFVAMIASELGFDGIYISGAGISNELGLPDVGLTTQTEVVGRGRAISRVTELPSIIDIDTGFGEAMSVARTVQELEDNGLAGCHLEDQMNPKRCGHLDGKSLVETSQMVQKISAAVRGKRDPNFLIIARTDARASEGLDKAIARAQAYVDAGAEMIFPEALENEAEFEKFRKAIKVPLLANMTEFGKSKLLTAKQLEALGFNLVIYPQTAFRLAMKGVEDGLRSLKDNDNQEALLPQMQHRARLYEIVRYKDYNDFDTNIFNFSVKK